VGLGGAKVAISNTADVAEATEHRLEVVTRQLAAADGTAAELTQLEAATVAELKGAQAQHAAVPPLALEKTPFPSSCARG
jgi:hypothetical protein